MDMQVVPSWRSQISKYGDTALHCIWACTSYFIRIFFIDKRTRSQAIWVFQWNRWLIFFAVHLVQFEFQIRTATSNFINLFTLDFFGSKLGDLEKSDSAKTPLQVELGPTRVWSSSIILLLGPSMAFLARFVQDQLQPSLLDYWAQTCWPYGFIRLGGGEIRHWMSDSSKSHIEFGLSHFTHLA